MKWFNRGAVTPLFREQAVISCAGPTGEVPDKGLFGSILKGMEIPVVSFSVEGGSPQSCAKEWSEWYRARSREVQNGETIYALLIGREAIVPWVMGIKRLAPTWDPDYRVIQENFIRRGEISTPIMTDHPDHGVVQIGQLLTAFLDIDPHDLKALRGALGPILEGLGGRRNTPTYSREEHVGILPQEKDLSEILAAVDEFFWGALSIGDLCPPACKYLNVNPASPLLTYDIETKVSDKHPEMMTVWHPRARLLCISFSVLKMIEGRITPVSLVMDSDSLSTQVLDAVFYRAAVIGAHNRNYDTVGLSALESYTIPSDVNLCSMGAGYVINQNPIPEAMGGQGLGLKSLSQYHLGAPAWEDELSLDEERIKKEIQAETRQVSAENRKRAKAGDDPLPLPEPFTYEKHDKGKLMLYCGKDTGNGASLLVVILQLIAHIDEKEPNDGLSLSEFYYNLYTPMLDDLVEIEKTGICVDSAALAKSKHIYEAEIERIHKALERHPLIVKTCQDHGVNFNVKSPAFTSALIQVTECEKLSVRSKSSGNYSCDKKVLSKLRAEHVDHAMKSPTEKLWNYIFYERRYRDLISKNINALSPYILEEDRVHPSIRTAKMEDSDKGDAGGTKTSRVTTKNPSTNTMINDKEFLRAFNAPPGMFMAKADYTSIEPLWHALLSGFTPWIDAFRLKRSDPKNPLADLYKVSYAPVIGVEPVDVVGSVRDTAKVFLLAMLYDRHYSTLAEVLQISKDKAREMCDAFWESHRALCIRSNRIKLEYLKGNPIRNIFGQRAAYPLRVSGAYSARLLDTIEDKFMDQPLYAWGESAILASMGLLGVDLEQCRAVGNWEIQSSGWTMTASMIGPLREHLVNQDSRAQIPETIHDAYRMYLTQTPEASQIVDGAYDFLQDLSNGRLNGLAGTAKLEKRIGMTLKEVPLVIEIQVGPTGGEMKVHERGSQLWMLDQHKA